MTASQFAFLGIGTEQGQREQGLRQSPLKALELMPKHWPIYESLLLTQNKEHSPVVRHHNQLAHLNKDIYQRAFDHSRRHLSKGCCQITWGGDHSVALSSVAAFLDRYPQGNILWIDAHADLNTPESSLTGNFHGMPLSILLGVGKKPECSLADFWSILSPKRLIYFGIRDLDPFETSMMASLGIKSLFAQELVPENFPSLLGQMVRILEEQPLHVSFDIDSMDPNEAPSTGVKASGGLREWQILEVAESLFELKNVMSMDIVEINPFIGTPKEVIRTYHVAFNFLERLFNFGGEYQRASKIATIPKKLPFAQQWNTPFWP